ncbi:hypothetical protein QJS04_geneDACA011900 [Acorus gramineus]|uniref:Uncharacterized protein n=1 Tax=Acorus gramineus TaxID=55184 RepID=A0AAV9AII9_ACOGR|nr:hypothetical protein QJS04_geneDACA011900 [Acorus gramineus]
MAAISLAVVAVSPHLLRPKPLSPFPPSRRSLRVSAARRGASSSSSYSRKGRLENRGRKDGVPLTTTTTTTREGEEDTLEGVVGTVSEATAEAAGPPMPDLPGLEPDFWEGSQWDPLGFFVQYLWAFGIGFALIACGIAVATYNEGATDFKETPVYKESIQSRELLEEPDASSSEDVFEVNPTEEAPSLE